MSGKIWLSDTERERLFDYMSGTSLIRENKDWFASVSKLSDRQLQIFTLIGKGLGTVSYNFV